MALVTSNTVHGRCAVCSAGGKACTSPGHSDDNDMPIVDLPREERTMAQNDPKPLKTYDVVYNGHPTQMKLNEDDAKRLGGTLPGAEPQSAPASKARTAPNK
jgi:hypothetical protein